MIGIQQVDLSYSNFKNEILNVLKAEGYIEDFTVVTADNKKNLQVTLKYFRGRPVIEKLKRISRPALRVYRGCQDLPVVRSGLGVAIISTPKGVMTDRAARAQQVGGEVLCTVE